MMRKAALVGCSKGAWIAIQNLRRPQLRASGSKDSVFIVEHAEGERTKPLPPGTHAINKGTFVRVHLLAGDPEVALCDIISGGEDVQA